MQLTGKQIVEQGIVYNHTESGVQQQGVDVRLDQVAEVVGEGFIPREGKTVKSSVEKLISLSENDVFNLKPGYFEITFKEGCNIPANAVLNFKTRSSLVRCGATVYSGQFDGGFKTDAMGCFLEVRKPIRIERGARIAQAVVVESYEVADDDLYDGQWQNDNQREETTEVDTAEKKTTKRKSKK